MIRWEASDALRKKLEQSGLKLKGGAGGWAEVYRVFKECKVCRVQYSFG